MSQDIDWIRQLKNLPFTDIRQDPYNIDAASSSEDVTAALDDAILDTDPGIILVAPNIPAGECTPGSSTALILDLRTGFVIKTTTGIILLDLAPV